MCMRVLFHQTKNGFLSFLTALSMKLSAAVVTSSSTVSMRLIVSGPVSVDLAAGETMDDAARAELLLELRVLRVVGMLWLLLRVQVVEVAEEFVEPVIGRQHLVAVTEVVLAELAGHVTLRL